MDDALDKLRVRKKLLHHDGTGGVVVGQERIDAPKGAKWRDFILLEKIDVRKREECWPWLGAVRAGYGQLSLGKYRNCVVHRAVFSIVFGQVPDGLFVRHKCDNPPCCNPFHLEPGTPMDNMHDKIQRGRANWALGEKQGSAKLKTHQIPEIRSLSASGVTQREIAKRYRMSLGVINGVINRNRWKHVQ